MLSYHQESGLKLENTLSNMLAINPHLELMLPDLEKCSIKNLWKDKPEKVESAQLEKSFLHNALMRLSGKLHSVSLREVSSYWE